MRSIELCATHHPNCMVLATMLVLGTDAAAVVYTSQVTAQSADITHTNQYYYHVL
jgi:hypothetical protein